MKRRKRRAPPPERVPSGRFNVRAEKDETNGCGFRTMKRRKRRAPPPERGPSGRFNVRAEKDEALQENPRFLGMDRIRQNISPSLNCFKAYQGGRGGREGAASVGGSGGNFFLSTKSCVTIRFASINTACSSAVIVFCGC